MSGSLDGRVAVVTGAGVRVGRAIAEALGARDAQILVHYAHGAAGADETVQAIRAAGGAAQAVQGDLSRPDDVARVFAAADALGGCDLLVNSASIFERKPFEQIDDAAWRSMIDTNLSAPFYCCRAALPAMRRKGRGEIVNILDVGGALVPWSGYAHYCAAKAGLAMLTKCLALELAPTIRVNGIAPGPVLFPESYGEREKERALARVPLQRCGSPQDVVAALLFVVEGSRYVTGQVITVDGGRSIG